MYGRKVVSNGFQIVIIVLCRRSKGMHCAKGANQLTEASTKAEPDSKTETMLNEKHTMAQAACIDHSRAV